MDSLSVSSSYLRITTHPPSLSRAQQQYLLAISAVRTEDMSPRRSRPPRPNKRGDISSSTHDQSTPVKTTSISTATTTTTTTTRPQPPVSLPAALCNSLDSLINNFIDPALLRPSVDPRNVLADNFAPVGELPPTPCPVVRGRIPACLAGGAYIRNGPNPQHLPRGPYHLFDGDGMLHSLLLPTDDDDGQGVPLLCSRFVRTYRYLLERDSASPVLPNVFSAFHGPAGIARGAVSALRVLTGQMDPLQGVGLANTSLALFAGRLYALGESGLPYAVRISPGRSGGDIATLGRWDFGGMGMTAHPKIDPATGEMFAFRYGPVPPYLTYFRFSRTGERAGPEVPIFSMRDPSFLHDFALTKHHALFPDIQVVMKPADMVLGGGSPVGSDPRKVPRIGVLPRYAESEAEIRWFEVPGFNPMHAINAWEEEDTIVLVAPNVMSIEHALDRMELVHGCVEMVRIDLRGEGVVSRTPLSAGNLDFGVINPRYTGRRNRYAYMGVGDPMPKISGVAKLDFTLSGRGDCVVAQRDLGPGRFGGEPFFVPSSSSDDVGKEDEGYVVSYVHDEVSGQSSFVVMDAKSPELEVVAEVLLPRRVPYGFHGLFVSQADLQSQQQQ